MGGGVVQDVAGLGHLDHEGRLPAGEVVAGADAGQDAVDRADHRPAGRHEAADVGQQHDQRVLPHVGRFTAHVRAGDDQHATVRIQVQVIGFERLFAYRFDYWMAAAFDLQARLGLQLRARPVQRLRAFGEGGQHVQFAQRSGTLLQRFQLPAKGVQQLLVQVLLARQRTVARGQHLVLECLQFFGDVALGIGQRLPAGVVHRRTIGLALADFDVVAVDAVVAHLQGGNTAALALAQFQVDQNWSAWVDSRRSSSSSSSKPSASTPPSLSFSGGISAMALASSCAHASCSPSAACRACRRGESSGASTSRTAGSRPRAVTQG